MIHPPPAQNEAHYYKPNSVSPVKDTMVYDMNHNTDQHKNAHSHQSPKAYRKNKLLSSVEKEDKFSNGLSATTVAPQKPISSCLATNNYSDSPIQQQQQQQQHKQQAFIYNNNNNKLKNNYYAPSSSNPPPIISIDSSNRPQQQQRYKIAAKENSPRLYNSSPPSAFLSSSSSIPSRNNTTSLQQHCNIKDIRYNIPSTTIIPDNQQEQKKQSIKNNTIKHHDNNNAPPLQKNFESKKDFLPSLDDYPLNTVSSLSSYSPQKLIYKNKQKNPSSINNNVITKQNPQGTSSHHPPTTNQECLERGVGKLFLSLANAVVQTEQQRNETDTLTSLLTTSDDEDEHQAIPSSYEIPHEKEASLVGSKISLKQQQQEEEEELVEQAKKEEEENNKTEKMSLEQQHHDEKIPLSPSISSSSSSTNQSKQENSNIETTETILHKETSPLLLIDPVITGNSTTLQEQLVPPKYGDMILLKNTPPNKTLSPRSEPHEKVLLFERKLQNQPTIQSNCSIIKETSLINPDDILKKASTLDEATEIIGYQNTQIRELRGELTQLQQRLLEAELKLSEIMTRTGLIKQNERTLQCELENTQNLTTLQRKELRKTQSTLTSSVDRLRVLVETLKRKVTNEELYNAAFQQQLKEERHYIQQLEAQGRQHLKRIKDLQTSQQLLQSPTSPISTTHQSSFESNTKSKTKDYIDTTTMDPHHCHLYHDHNFTKTWGDFKPSGLATHAAINKHYPTSESDPIHTTKDSKTLSIKQNNDSSPSYTHIPKKPITHKS